MRFCLHPWKWNTDRWEPAWDAPMRRCLGRLDLRNSTQSGTRGPTEQGVGLFAHDDPTFVPMLDLGDDAFDSLGTVQRSGVHDLLDLGGTTLSSRRLSDLFAELMLRHGDPTGQSRFKPLRGAIGGRASLLIGQAAVLLNERVEASHDAWVATREVFRADYRRLRSAVGTQEDLDVLRRWTGFQVQKNRLASADDILPSEHRADGMLSPSTTVGDTFTDTNGTSLDAHTPTGANAGSGWTEYQGTAWAIQSNTADMSGNVGANNARMDDDLSGDDHYCQVTIDTLTRAGGVTVVSPSTRKDSTATITLYRMTHIMQSGNDRHELAKRVNNSETTLDTWSTAPSAGQVSKNEANGSTIKGYVDTVERLSATDTEITGNLRTGIDGFSNDSGNTVRLDDFEAADLAVGGANPKGVFGLPFDGPFRRVVYP